MIIVQQELNVRVDIDLKTVGTLVVTEKGLGFKVPRGKCHSPSVIPWDKITQAFEMKPGDAERHES
jgi:hypothetical protein